MQSQYTLPPLRLYCICMVLHDVANMAIVFATPVMLQQWVHVSLPIM